MPVASFVDLPPTPAQHFKLYYFAAVLRLLEQVATAFGSFEAAVEHFPFLAGYQEEVFQEGREAEFWRQAESWWWLAVEAWEDTITDHLPLRALRRSASLDHFALTLLLTCGLLEEDAHFGPVFESLQGTPGQQRPTIGLLGSWWCDTDGCSSVVSTIRCLQEVGLLQVINPEAPRAAWALQPPALIWEALHGERPQTPAGWLRYLACEILPALDELVLPEAVRQAATSLPKLLDSGQAQGLIARGPQHNGRHTLVAAVARALKCGLLDVYGLTRPDDDRWRLVGPLSTLMHALPTFVLDPAPGETIPLPALTCYTGPIGVVLGKPGGVSGPVVERAVTVVLDIPEPELRQRHWQTSLETKESAELIALGQRFRMTGGNIRRTAARARTQAALEGRASVTLDDIQEARRVLNHQSLDTLATPLCPTGDWSDLAVSPETLRELRSLEDRCRHREQLRRLVGPALGRQLNVGVRALFSGPSGTGKSLAARLLAASLHMDLYRLDLSAVVNKYIGETEKNLNQVLARAEELDVLLLLDEGDALLTARTSVQTSNDRYANLETNYLLQRLETFEGILVITTNAAERIDTAFQRRIDVVVEFRAPDVSERWSIWQMHLPVGHEVEPALLREVAGRCALAGGQIRNAVLHATVLAIGNGGIVQSKHLEAAIHREYRKTGGVCPLRATANLCKG
jgi:hypothetical protein